MSLIQVSDLTFSYDSHFEAIFEGVSFAIDTDWKLGFIGRNGRGKTTFLKLLMGEYPHGGTIKSSVSFDYFPLPLPADAPTARAAAKAVIAPYARWEAEMEAALLENTPEALQRYGEILEAYLANDGYEIDHLLERETGRLLLSPEALERPLSTLSGGERTKLMLAALFLKKNNFLLIDEPTNHLDREGREAVGQYLAGKKGFILVSHDRRFLDTVVDHILSINRCDIEVQRGNYSSWRENKDRQDTFEAAEDEKLRGEIQRLTVAARQKADWSDKVEESKFGTRNAGLRPDRGFIGHKSAKMMKRAKTIEARQQQAVEDKSKLLKNLEKAESLKLHPLPYQKARLLECRDLVIDYGQGPLFAPVGFSIGQGERIALTGPNGCGKSSLIHLLLGEELPHRGTLTRGSGLILSHISQETGFLKGELRAFIEESQIDETLFKAILRKLDFSREQFEKPLESYSGGQKKKVLLARSLCQPAHLYVWDEPLNFLDLYAREQIEALILAHCPTMIFVEHDAVFCERIGTRAIPLLRG